MSELTPQPDDAVPMRDRLLNAAVQIVARDGVSNLTLEAVAREAGVSKGGLLYHFPSKSAMIEAVVERLACRCDTNHAEALQRDPIAAGAFTRAYLTARVGRPEPHELPVHTALLAAAGTDPHYLEPFRDRMAEWQSRLERDGIDSATASIVRLAIDGLCLCRLLGMPVPQGALLDQVVERLLAMTQTTNTPCSTP